MVPFSMADIEVAVCVDDPSSDVPLCGGAIAAGCCVATDSFMHYRLIYPRRSHSSRTSVLLSSRNSSCCPTSVVQEEGYLLTAVSR